MSNTAVATKPAKSARAARPTAAQIKAAKVAEMEAITSNFTSALDAIIGHEKENLGLDSKYSAYVVAAAAANNPVTKESVKGHVSEFGERAMPGVQSSPKADIGTPERDLHNLKQAFRKGIRNAADLNETRTNAVTMLTPAGRAVTDLEALLAAVKDEWIAAQG